jgi:oxygen-independent coproporphyrinogen-3 oxidase
VSIDHLYVHVPFCASKCPYCDFNSHAGRDAEAPTYVDALVAEARARGRGIAPRTMFVGGGTPTQLGEAALDRALGGVLAAIDSSRLVEATVEANPGTLTPSKIRVLRKNKITRVSLGAQSFDDRRLKVLGRVHESKDTVRSVEMLRDGGVERISLDLILATPGQTIGEQRRDVARAIALEPEHISTYVLTFEEGTAFTKSMREGKLPAPVEGRDLEHLHAVADDLAAAGYRRYEVSNFSKPGAECLHNLGYWRTAEWLGLGAGAHSHVAGRTWKNLDDPAGYSKRVFANGEAVEWEERVHARSALLESLMMGLRLCDEGVGLAELAARHGIDPRSEYGPALSRHVSAGFLSLDGSRLRCTPTGLDVLNTLLLDFVPDEAPTTSPTH